MLDLAKDPYVVAAVGAVISGLLFLRGAAYVQDGLKFKGYAYIAVGVYAVLMTFFLSRQAMTVVLGA